MHPLDAILDEAEKKPIARHPLDDILDGVRAQTSVIEEEQGNIPEGLLDLLPGVGDVTQMYRGAIAPVSGAVRGATQGLASPLLESTSVPLNVASGIPGTIGATLGEFLSQEIEQAPETLALGKMGGALKHLGVFPALKAGVRKVAPGLAFRGKLTDVGRQAFNDFATAERMSQVESEDIGNLLSRGLSKEERQTIGGLMEQPAQRKALLSGEVDLENIRGMAADVPGVIGGKERAAMFALPPTQLPPERFADIAETAAQALGKARKDIEELAIKDPQFFARFNENYLPRMYSEQTIHVIPTKATRENKSFLKMRNEMKDEDRMVKGMVTDPAGPVSARLAQERRLINTRNLFDTLSTDYRVAKFPTTPDEMKLGAGELMDMGGEMWKKIPNDPSFGPLSGKLMRVDEAKEVEHLINNEGMGMKVAKQWWQAWKFGKTVMNVKTHIRNFYSNTLMAHAAGLSPYRLDIYKRAAQEIRKGGDFWDEARKIGAPWTLRRNNQMLDFIEPSTMAPDKVGSIYEAIALDLPRLLTGRGAANVERINDSNVGVRALMKVGSVVGKASKVASDLYQDSEALFKHALYIQMRRKGMAPTDAAGMANEAIIDYGKMPLFVRKIRAFPGAIPFVSFTYGAAPLAAKAAIEKPQIIQHYNIFADSFNAVSAETANASKDEIQAVRAAFPGTIPMIMPFRDSTGSLMVMDVSRNTPVSDFLPGRMAIPGVPQLIENVLGKSPAINEAAAQWTETDPAFKQRFMPEMAPEGLQGAIDAGISEADYNELMSPVKSERLRGRLTHLGRTALPELAGGGATQNIYNAVRGQESFLGEQKGIPQSLIENLLTGPLRNLEDARNRQALALKKNVGQIKPSVKKQERRAMARKK